MPLFLSIEFHEMLSIYVLKCTKPELCMNSGETHAYKLYFRDIPKIAIYTNVSGILKNKTK